MDLAVKAAKNAFKLNSPWRTMDAIDRGNLLHKLADLMQRDAAHLAALESLDNGKPYQIALNVDIPGSIETLHYYAGWADKIHGKVIPIRLETGPSVSCRLHCCDESGRANALVRLACLQVVEAGFPPGVVNVLTGYQNYY